MNALFFVIAFCIVAVLVYMARYSGRLRVTQTRTIQAPLAVVYAQVADLQHWRAWNPWLEHEADVPLTLSARTDATGSTLAWQSTRLGSGRIVHRRLKSPMLIEQTMDFRQPFRFRGRARWQFKDRGGATEVSWSMRGRVGFTMRAFAPTVQGMVALDFRYGLARLAATVEPGAAMPYTIRYLGPREVEAMRLACLSYRGPLDGLPAAVPETIGRVRQQLAAAGAPTTGSACAVYIKTQVKQRTTECRIGVAIDPLRTEHALGELTIHNVPAHRAYVVQLQGHAEGLEIAWYHAMQRMRIEGVEPDLRIPPFERYLNDATVDGAVDAELHIAMRAATT